jgi:hypothetical protein
MLYCRVNVGCGPAEERVLLTGLHAVADIYCECCKTTLGWKYVSVLAQLCHQCVMCVCDGLLKFCFQILIERCSAASWYGESL